MAEASSPASRSGDPRSIVLDLLECVLAQKRLLDETLDSEPRPTKLAGRGPRSFEDICHAPDYDYRSQECMMLDLEVETVIAAARALLESAA